MNISNKKYINILKNLLIYTDKKNCWLIGSSCLVLLSQGYPGNNYKYFLNDTEVFKSRDLDFVTTIQHNLYEKLCMMGKLELVKSVNSGYKSLMFRSRNIINVDTFIFELGNPKTEIGYIIKNLINHKKIILSIDLITVSTDTIKDSVSYWPIAETKRNIGLYYENNEIQYTELTDISIYHDLSEYTLGNMIETLKNLLQLCGSPIYSYSLTGDKINKISYKNNDLIHDDTSLGKQKRLYDVLNGNSIELAELIDIPCYMYNELPEKYDKNIQCVICMNELCEIKNKLIILNCGHIFCVGCIVPLWISYLIMRFNRLNDFISKEEEAGGSSNKCPLCRREIFKIMDKIKRRNKDLNIDDYCIEILNF